MSAVTDIIFNNEKHYITSVYGKRDVISTSAGNTSSFHNGTDYGTYNKKLPQYAIEDGTVLSCGTALDGAKYVWVSYPRTGKKLLHYHLDTIAVRSGQQVSRGTLLGTTGMTGKATGIHLHLGVKDLKTDEYEDPEKFSASYEKKLPKKCGIYKVTTKILNVRTGPGTTYAIKSFGNFTLDAQRQIRSLCGYNCSGFVKGVICNISQIKNGNWGKAPSGWICLDYCTEI